MHRTAANRLSSQSRRSTSRAGEGHITDTNGSTSHQRSPQHQSGATSRRITGLPLTLIRGSSGLLNSLYANAHGVVWRKLPVLDEVRTRYGNGIIMSFPLATILKRPRRGRSLNHRREY